MTSPLSRRTRGVSSVDLATDGPHPGEVKQAWVYRQIRDGILGGALPAGARLPSTRSLAERWQLARMTVEAAYDQLRGEGYLVSAVGSGTYVSATLPDRFVTAAAACPPARGGTAAPAPASAAEAPRAAPFGARLADAALFPLDEWRRLLAGCARRITPAQLSADEPLGAWPLREQIAHYLGTARGIACDAGQVIVLSGIRHALDLSARLLLSAGDQVLIEDPAYMNAEPIFRQYAARVVPLPVDQDGFAPAAARRYRRARLAYVTPAHQSPLGMAMPAARRMALLDWAGQNDCWILEDDYDSEFNYERLPLPALKSLDEGDRVIHCGSFNKTLFAALRIGYAVLPRRLVPAFSELRRITGRSNSVIEQLALAEFLRSGAFARHLRRARAAYQQRRDRVLQCLREAVGEAALRVSGEQAGFHFVWWLPPGLDEAAVLAAARAHGLRLESLSALCHRVSLPPGVLVGFSAWQDEEVVRLGEMLRGLLRRR
ncbi:GntR family transcriptional regulator [Cupriavidus sp. USMAA2-4]|nr:GntR family transcriptional regulator [Cupriavidus sp. USMAA2-4]